MITTGSTAKYAAMASAHRALTRRMPPALPAPAPRLALPAPQAGYVVIQAGELKRALDELAKFYGKRSSLPVLSYVHMLARPGRLTLSATNLDAALQIKLECKGRPYFSLCAPLAYFQKVLAGVDSSLSITKEGYTLIVRKQSSGGIIRLKGMDAEEYPTIPSDFPVHYFSIDSTMLGKEIERLARGAATDEARPVFTGILFQVAHGYASLASADSYRLHVSRVALDRMGLAGDCLIPAKNLQLLASILPKKSTMIHFWTNPGKEQIAIRWNGHTVLTRLIDGAFPAYQRIMPDASPAHYAVTDAKQMLDTVALVGKVVADEANSIVKIGWQAGKVSRVVVSAEADELGSMTEYVKADLDEEEKTNEQFIMVNYKYLVDALKCITGYAVLRFWSPQKPLTVRPLDEDNNFVAVLMPMHTIR